MRFKNTSTRYGGITKTLHWVTALAVIGLIAVGLYMVDLPNGSDKFKMIGLHKSFGICVLALTVLRIIWHFFSKKPALLESLKNWEKNIAHITHILLYMALIGMPLSGWAMSSAAQFPVNVFGLFTLPPLIEPDKELGKIFREIHGLMGYALMFAVALHITGAAKHAIMDKDGTLKRMLPFTRGE